MTYQLFFYHLICIVIYIILAYGVANWCNNILLPEGVNFFAIKLIQIDSHEYIVWIVLILFNTFNLIPE